jgi:hypothetical protein
VQGSSQCNLLLHKSAGADVWSAVASCIQLTGTNNQNGRIGGYQRLAADSTRHFARLGALKTPRLESTSPQDDVTSQLALSILINILRHAVFVNVLLSSVEGVTSESGYMAATSPGRILAVTTFQLRCELMLELRI